MSECARAIDTGYLNFTKLDEPFFIKGRAGVLMKDRDKNNEWVEYENPYKNIEYER